jgi:hypothetical protein
MLSIEKLSLQTTQLKNKGLCLIDEIFRDKGFILLKNEIDWIVYSKPGKDLDCFEFRLDKNKIHVCVPIKNSLYQYKTSFSNYFDAFEYIETRMHDYL